MQVSNSVIIWLLILIKVNGNWPDAGLSLDVLIDYFYLPNCASWRDLTGDLALTVSLEFRCLAYLQHSEIIEKYNTHNCSLGPCCHSVCSTTGWTADTEQNGLDFAKTVKATSLLQRSPGAGGADFHPSVKEGGDLEAYGAQGRERDVPTCSAGGSPLQI